ncbi:hypothetical protein QTP70_004235 [Hemibagrus guttatus]|uniref:FYVE-type domain-containing protein n=1 Tax=Hemibagrus guttatus TaxID=175788 RepID=A0AAE0UK09_9TELE|nr:hypothetical protein QTP70_004235 [Hemibagrus guttatus]
MERLENMRRSAVGNGLSQCLLCGEALGLLGTPSVLCFDCCKKVCTKCGIETACSQKRAQWLCKICSEQREIWECQLLQNMWKRSGAWFYKFLPKYIHPEKDSFMNRRPVMEREEQPVARSVPITYTWAHRKVDSSESDGSDSELSDASSDRKTFIPESIKRRHSALSESSGNIGLTPLQSILSSPSRASFLSESHSSLGSERGSLVPAPEDEDTEQGRTSLWVGLSPLVPVKGTLNASVYQDILNNFMLPALWEQFGDDPFLFQHDCTPVHKAMSIKTWMSEFGVEELDWSAQSPDLNLIEHLWDELEQRLRASP